ncbi:CBO0543 family protein [Neobacillus drentensis]|uniref:CBO0543 family protein n=1 Tax=Neobacillus drentensis TaxID=220684 RepID=UPI003B5878A6
MYYPEKRNKFIKSLYYLFHTLLVIVPELIALKYTKLIRYPNWKWYWSFITIWLSYFLSRMYQRWFFQNKNQKN